MPKRTNNLLSVSTLAAAVLAIGTFIVVDLMVRNQDKIAEGQSRRFLSYRLADEVRQSSDDLTKMARTYVVTQDPRFEEYFNRILEIRDGRAPRPVGYHGVYWDFVTATGKRPRPDGEPVALQSLMEEYGFTSDEFTLLDRAKGLSDDLVALEERAMHAVKGQFPDSTGAFSVRGEPDLALARDLLHGKEYHESKALIMAPIDEFVTSVDARTAEENAALGRFGRRLGVTVRVILGLGIMLLVVTGVLMRRTARASAPDAVSTGATSASALSMRTAWPLLTAASVAILGVILLAGWNQARIEDQMRADTGNALATVVQATTGSVQHWFSGREREAQVMAGNLEVRSDVRALLDEDASLDSAEMLAVRADLRTRLDEVVLGLGYQGYLLLSPEGEVLASHDPAAVPIGARDVVRGEFLASALSAPAFGAIELPHLLSIESVSPPTPTMLIGAAVRDDDGVVVAALVLLSDPQRTFTEILQRGRIGESGESYAFDRSGTLISESRFDDQLRDIGLLTGVQNAVLNIQIRDPGGNLTEGFQSMRAPSELPLTLMARQAITTGSGANLDGYNDYRGVPVLGAWTWDETHGIGVATEVDVAEAYRSALQTRRFSILTSLASVLLVLALSGLFLRNRVRMATAQSELESVAQRFRSVTESASDAVISSDSNSTIVGWNGAAEHMFGWSEEEIIGRPVETVVPERFRTMHRAGMTRRTQTGESRLGNSTVELTGLHRSGHEFPIEMSLATWTVGTNVFYTGIFRDVTERKRMEDDLLSTREAAESANRTKSAFLANMSHELRTPMNAIIGYSEMLIEESEDLEPDEFVPDLTKIRAAGKHLLTLINDILDLSKIEAGKMELYLETFDLSSMIDEVAATVDTLIKKKDNALQINKGDDLGSMHADVTKLRQVLFNLISNAAKFTDQGTITLDTHREATDDGDWITFVVADTGIGVAADKIGKLFDEFTQADASTTRKFGGTGLGLAITKRFCQLMGGDITAESTLGEGSTFTIRLPAEGRAVAEAATDEQSEAPARGSAVIAEGPTGPCALVIDDDPNSRNLIQRSLTKDGFSVILATGGEEGLRLAREKRPDLITLDVMMPGMDGWAVLRELKADPEVNQIPVIMVTMVDDQGMGYALGAADYLTKPIDHRQLVTLLGRYRGERPSGSALIVEDDANTRELMRRQLEGARWTVREAENGKVALDRVREEQPELILLDLMMPEMDGFEFLLELRRDEAWRDIPVVVVSAKDLTDEDRRRLSGNAASILQKGAYTRTEFLRQVRGAMTRYDVDRGESGDGQDPAG
ncbi:MAG: response regulator [bacterium]|nr:response regulator [bacterium]